MKIDLILGKGKATFSVISSHVGLILLIALLMCSIRPSAAATKTKQASVPTRQELKSNFAALADSRPSACSEAPDTRPLPTGWRLNTTQCAWHDNLQMRRWELTNNSPASACVSAPAIFWNWLLSKQDAKASPAVWNRAWSTQSMIEESDASHRIALLERKSNNTWVATEWRWRPSLRAATRRWQQAHWQLLVDVATDIQQSAPKNTVTPESALLNVTWKRSLDGRAGEIVGEQWLWERKGVCLRMETVGLSQAQLQLPYSKDDSRLEQRSAMQLRLARTYPKATWLTQFRQLALPEPMASSGAKYEAIWMDNNTVKGQLWMPTKGDGAIFRARIISALPPMTSTASDNNAAVSEAIAHAIEGELVDLAITWTRSNE